jgi:hypothetical protein
MLPSYEYNNSRALDQIDIFWAGSDGKVYAAWNKLGGTWDNHVYQIAGNYPAPASGTSIAAISRTLDQIDILWNGDDGKIYAAWNKFGSTWDNHIYQIEGNYLARI